MAKWRQFGVGKTLRVDDKINCAKVFPFKTLPAGALAEKESLTPEEVFLAARES
jgi:hypothetical protein